MFGLKVTMELIGRNTHVAFWLTLSASLRRLFNESLL